MSVRACVRACVRVCVCVPFCSPTRPAVTELCPHCFSEHVDVPARRNVRSLQLHVRRGVRLPQAFFPTLRRRQQRLRPRLSQHHLPVHVRTRRETGGREHVCAGQHVPVSEARRHRGEGNKLLISQTSLV